MKKPLALLIPLLVVIAVLSQSQIGMPAAAADSKIYIDPASKVTDTTFTVYVKTNSTNTDIWAWEFTLVWNPLVLSCSGVVNGDLITTSKHADAKFIAGTPNNTIGKLSLTTAYIDYLPPATPPTISGPGTLANVTFTVVGSGDSPIELGQTKLIGISDGEKYSIVDGDLGIGVVADGYFKTTSPGTPTHDGAAAAGTGTPLQLYRGENLTITASVTNLGNVAERFEVSFYLYFMEYSDYFIKKETVDVAAAATHPFSFAWSTSGFIAGSYNVTVIVSEVWFETATGNNKLTITPQVHIRILGDMNGDREVNSIDRALYTGHAPSTPATSPWADLDNDNDVDGDDNTIFAGYYGLKEIVKG